MGDGLRRRISEYVVQAQPVHLSAPTRPPSGCGKQPRLGCVLGRPEQVILELKPIAAGAGAPTE